MIIKTGVLDVLYKALDVAHEAGDVTDAEHREARHNLDFLANAVVRSADHLSESHPALQRPVTLND